MTEFLNQISANRELIPVLAITILGVITLAAIISVCVYKIRRHTTTAQLKQDMLDRGMSADEIKTVLEAGTKRWLGR